MKTAPTDERIYKLFISDSDGMVFKQNKNQTRQKRKSKKDIARRKLKMTMRLPAEPRIVNKQYLFDSSKRKACKEKVESAATNIDE